MSRSYWDDTYDKSKKYEAMFFDLFKTKSKKPIQYLGGKDEPDFIVGNDKVELKSDFHKDSNNVFVEIIANTYKNTDGGPYQSLKYGTKFFLNWFPLDNGENLFVFNNSEFCSWLDLNKDKYRECKIKNKNYYTIGILIPKDELLCQPFCTLKSLEVH
jgi:hypothetical protein